MKTQIKHPLIAALSISVLFLNGCTEMSDQDQEATLQDREEQLWVEQMTQDSLQLAFAQTLNEITVFHRLCTL